ncbi:YkgJ family cysteine cluster protein [Halosolutus gelatinilyticus]|uniref:YkgJ family cysteine cluster protein n=1 Tax=Halosolutus gelatinilyticus TaxID=2931975 RepID=UPI001FF63762|nr:YkgJ family cysteine cluster protein [Halosolutus gelatinilyticus]
MEVNCAGCAGCCLDWRSLLDRVDGTDSDFDRECDGDGTRRRLCAPEADDDAPRREPLDDDVNFVPLTRDEVRAFLDRGLAAALTPRFWAAADEAESVEIDGRSLAAIAGRPVFFVGLRKPPKPVAPFGREEPAWLPTCTFLDPTTLQCRIHEDDLFPAECGAYPEHNLALDQETECERVESAFGGERLLDGDHGDPEGLLLGSQAIGAKLFCHPEPDRLDGIVGRAASGGLTATDRAECLAVAAASSPGTVAISDHHYERALETIGVHDGEDGPDGDENGDENGDESWVGPAIREWVDRRRNADGTVPSPTVARTVEEARGAPKTPGWDAIE